MDQHKIVRIINGLIEILELNLEIEDYYQRMLELDELGKSHKRTTEAQRDQPKGTGDPMRNLDECDMQHRE